MTLLNAAVVTTSGLFSQAAPQVINWPTAFMGAAIAICIAYVLGQAFKRM